MAVKVFYQYCTNNDCYKEHRPLDHVLKLIVHSPAVIKASGYTSDVIISANDWHKRWNKPGLSKLTHGFIDADGVHIFQHLNMTAWQAGNWYGNCNSIGFELCEYTDLNKARKVYDNAVAYYAELVKKYNLSIDDVIGHKEAHDRWFASNHSDPDPYFRTFGKSMRTFREDMKKIIDGMEEKEMYILEGQKIISVFDWKPVVRTVAKDKVPYFDALGKQIGTLNSGNKVRVMFKTEKNMGQICIDQGADKRKIAYMDCAYLRK